MEGATATKPEASNRAWLRAFMLACAVGAVFAAGGASTCAYQALSARDTESGTVTTIVRDTPAVVAAVRDLARLEGASYHMERVIDVRDRQAHLFGLFESEDAMLLVAAVDVVAGVDLALLGDGDVRVDPGHQWAELTLPAPVIFSARLDNDRTYVHTRATDRLALRAKTLETRARQEAERSLREAAIEAGILERARLNVARTIETLIEGLGFARVEVEFHDREL